MIFNKIIFFALLFFTIAFYSQETDKEIKNSAVEKSIPEYVEINGLVTDLGPIPNIVVFEKGQNNTVMTDVNGRFSIKIPFKNFTEKVFLRFENISLNYYKEIEVLRDTKFVTAKLEDKKTFSTNEPVSEVDCLKPDVTNLVLKAVGLIIDNQIRKKKSDKSKSDKSKSDN